MAKKKALTPEERLQEALVPKDEQPYEIPDNWCWTNVRTICVLGNGVQSESGTLPYLEVKFLRGKQKAKFKNTGRLIDKGTKLILVDGENSGEVFSASQKGYMGSTFRILNSANKVDENYLLYFISKYKDKFKSNKTGSAIPHLNKDMFYDLAFPFPPLAEQQRIVDKIENLFAKLDEAKENAQEVLDSFETRRAAILHKAFTGELTAKWREENTYIKVDFPEYLIIDKILYNIPLKWIWTKLGNITKIIGGGTPSSREKSYYEDGDIPWISPADLSGYNEKYISRGKRNITRYGLENSSTKMLPENTVCLSSRAPIGYVVIASNPICTNQGFKNFLPSQDYYSEYLYWYLKGNKELLESHASGTTFLELSASRVSEVEFPLPPFEEQKEIARILDDLLEKEEQAKDAAQQVLEQIDIIKKSILARAFRGELGTNDPSEESSIELLKEIVNRDD